MPCPFGFKAPPDQAGNDNDMVDSDAEKKRRKGKDPRFDYNSDPVSWFFQNQIRSEEEFQANKSRLRDEAREALQNIFEKKGKHLMIDSDDDFSICSSELSAWESDVASISSMVSCAADWVQETGFTAPALQQLRLVVVITMAVAAFSSWQSLQAILQVNRYWGIISYGWVPAAAFLGSIFGLLLSGGAWWVLGRMSKRHVLALQLCMQVLYALAVVSAVLCYAFPSQLDGSLRKSVCQPGNASSSNKLCQYLPLIEEQVVGAMRSILLGVSGLAVCAFSMSTCSAWYQWELGHVEKKAMKHKRRRKQRSKGIPWDRIKVEDIEPVCMVGGGVRKGKKTD